MNIIDEQYKSLLREILSKGEEKTDRTGTGTISLFAPSDLRIDVSTYVPAITLKQTPIKTITKESIWMFCQGSTNIKYLTDNNVKIWNEWQVDGDRGPIYGANFRAYQGHRKGELEFVDQLQGIITQLKNNKNSRRHVISGWNPSTVPIESLTFRDNYNLGRSVLPQCHGIVIQFYVHTDDTISMKYYIRSSDTILGLKANCINAYVLMRMVGQCTGYKLRELIITFGDAHIYKNHLEGVNELLKRDVLHSSPTLHINPDITDIDDFTFEDFTFCNYQYQDKIKFEVSV